MYFILKRLKELIYHFICILKNKYIIIEYIFIDLGF